MFTRDCFEQLAEKIKTVEQRIQQEIDAQFQLLEKCAAGLSLKRSSISKILDRVNFGETALCDGSWLSVAGLLFSMKVVLQKKELLNINGRLVSKISPLMEMETLFFILFFPKVPKL